MQVPELKECAQLCIIHHIIGIHYRNALHEEKRENLLQQLEEGAWGEESLAILNRVVKQQGYYLFPEVILALLPNTTKELCLEECPQVTEECLNVALQRCPQLVALDMKENPLLDLSKVNIFGSSNKDSFSSLSSIILEDCCQVTDDHIQNLLKNAPSLQHLNIGRCEITDRVFLLDEQAQLAREACLQEEFSSSFPVFSCQLQTVDVSRCSEFTSTGVRNLCTLCGPTLQSIDVSWTKVDCAAFLYLSGFGIPSTVEFFMQGDDMSTEVTEQLVYDLHQFHDIRQDIVQKWRDEEESPTRKQRNEPAAVSVDQPIEIDCQALKLALEQDRNILENSPFDLLDLNGRIKTSSHDKGVTVFDYVPGRSPNFQFLCTDDILCQSPPCSNDNFVPVTSPVGASSCVSTFCNESQNLKLCEGNIESTSSGTVLNSGDVFEGKVKEFLESNKKSELEINNLPCESSRIDEASCGADHLFLAGFEEQVVVDSSESLQIRDGSVSEADNPNPTSKSGSENGKHGSNESCQKEKVFFKSAIQTIYFTTNVFREETLGLRCFQKFLTMNKNLVSINLYGGITSGNFLTDNVLDLIGTYARSVEHLSVEGSDKITHTGILEIASHCKRLTSLDLTGVSFVGDEGIIPLLTSLLSLTHLKLAETRITGQCLTQLAALPTAKQLLELDLSWCEEVESTEAIDTLVSACPALHKLWLRECCMADTTLACIAQHCSYITELSLASNMNVMQDESLILLVENLPLLMTIDLGWNSYLTNQSIEALLSSCHHLTRANLEGLKLLTSSPFLPLIAVPEAVCEFLEAKRSLYRRTHPEEDSDAFMQLSDLPCLPHRSTTYSTSLRHVNLTYSDFVEDLKMQQIVTVTNGGLEILDYYGNKVEPCKASLEKFLIDYLNDRAQPVPITLNSRAEEE